MKKLALLVFLCSAAFAQSKPDGYPISVHVTASCRHGVAQKLNATINGKKYELEGSGAYLLRPGDYKAKLIEDKGNSYEVFQVYEFQFTDGKTRKFAIVGLEE